MHRKQIDFDKMTRRFLTEGKLPSVASFIQSLEEVLAQVRPGTRMDKATAGTMGTLPYSRKTFTVLRQNPRSLDVDLEGGT